MRAKVGSMIVMTLLALPALGQEGRFGARYSSYAVDLSVVEFSVETDRASSIGVFGSYRNGPIVFRGYLDHDFQADVGFFGFFDAANFQRDRVEASVGFRILDNLDLEGAVRYDSIDVGVADFFTDDLTASFQGGQFGFGATLHSDIDSTFGYEITGRYYLGSVDVDQLGDVDVTTIRVGALFPIRIADTPWTVIPGLEYERLETDDEFFGNGFLLDIESNRFSIGLAYNF